MSDGPATAWFLQRGRPDSERLYVHFNPASLRVALTNQFGEDPPEQHARPTTTKLDVELIFDTTQTGQDVRAATQLLRTLATATATAPGGGAEAQTSHSLPRVIFHWGTADYAGVIESLTETLDYWSSDGVPLRAAILVSMKGSSLDFLTYSARNAAATASNPAPALSDVTPIAAPAGGRGATEAATRGGAPGAARALAALNGMENMRAPGGGAMAAVPGAQLVAAAAFKMSGGVSAGASFGFSAGAAAGASAGAGLGASAGIGMAAGMGPGGGGSGGLGAGFGGAEFGAGASAGVSMGFSAAVSASGSASGSATAGVSVSQGAFAGLGASKTSLPPASFDPGLCLPSGAAAAGADARFDPTGRLVSDDGQVAVSYAANGGVAFR